jgi:hypothetical protein
MDNSVRTDYNDSSSSSLSSDEEASLSSDEEEIILSREDYFDELQFYYHNQTIEECMGEHPFHDHLTRTHVGQMELFMRTVQNGDYDEEMERDLRGDQFDFPEVVVPPAEWEERQRIEKENIKNELRNFTVNVASSSSDDSLFLMPKTGGFGREPLEFVLSDESIHHHWEQLVAAYYMPKNLGRQLRITIINVEIAKESMALLASSLGGRLCMWGFKFDNNNLCREWMMSLLTLVENNQEMTDFTLENNRIDDIHMAMSLSNVLKSHTGMERIHLNHCNLGNNVDILSLIRQSNVESIELIGNNIDSSGAIKIAEHLKRNTQMYFLFLDFNLFNDDDAVLLTHALKMNTNLKWINLESNRFTTVGIKALIKSIYDCSSLNAISESNHTLIKGTVFI